NSVNDQVNLTLDHVKVEGYTYNAKAGTMTENPLNLAIGNNYMLTIDCPDSEPYINGISGGKLSICDDVEISTLNNVTVRELYMGRAKLELAAKKNLTVQVKATTWTSELYSGTIVASDGNITMKDADVRYSEIRGSNLAFTGITTLANSNLYATQNAAVGQGKVTMADVELYDGHDSYVDVKQDKNGTSLFTVSGTVTEKGNDLNAVIITGLHYNNSSEASPAYVVMTDGTKIVTAQKADSEMFDVLRSYDGTVKTGNIIRDDYCLYKSGNGILYGNEDRQAVKLEGSNGGTSYFYDLGSALSDINARNQFDPDPRYIGQKNRPYDRFEITLLKDAEIKASNGKYAALNLPTKTAELTIKSVDPSRHKNILKYSGALNLKSDLVLEDIDLTPVNAVAVNGQSVEATTDLGIGGYTLTLYDTDTLQSDKKTSVIRNISGNKNGLLRLNTGETDLADPYTVKAAQVTGLTKLELRGDTDTEEPYAKLEVAGKNSINSTIIISGEME
ncbi:MAG: hypothetical protein K6G42_07720, partial [Lachnospiraceae bacterium]|nr:hypothetical protein [Lachnospiraceae bacterium]